MTVTMRDWILLAQCINIVLCQGVSTITMSKNPVYNGEPLTLTCTQEIDNAILVSVTMDAVNKTRCVGTLVCTPATGAAFQNNPIQNNPIQNNPIQNNPIQSYAFQYTGAGLFAGYRFTGCETDSVKRPSVSISASPSWELDYTCTFKILFKSTRIFQNVTSASTRLSVWVLPKAPTLHPSSLIFNDTDNLMLECTSTHGTPAAAIHFVVVQQNRQNSQQMRGVASASLMLPGPSKDWHNAEVTCSVENHNFPNMTARGVIRLNHISARHNAPLTVNTHLSSQTLDCSEDIRSFPKPSYKWLLPGDSYINSSAHHNTSVLTVPQGQSGFFVCIAVNDVTANMALATYHVTNIPRDATELITWLTPVICVLVVIVIVVLVVIYRCGYFKRKASTLRVRNEPQETGGNQMSPEQREVDTMLYTEDRQYQTIILNETGGNQMSPEQREVDTMLYTEDRQYQTINLQTLNESNYSQLTVTPQTYYSTAYDYIQS